MRRGSTSRQSATGQAVLRSLGLPLDVYESFLFVEDDAVYAKSEGFFRMLRHLRQPWPWLRLARGLPRSVSDWAMTGSRATAIGYSVGKTTA